MFLKVLQRYVLLSIFANKLMFVFQKQLIMALNTNKNLKTYYSIDEVANMFGLNKSTLRYWQKEFPQLKPKTGDNGVRMYTEKDIETLKVIFNLVKVRGFKLAAARKMLQANREGVDKNSEVLERLIQVRDELKALKAKVDSLV